MSVDYEYVCKCGWQGASDEMDCVLAFPGTDDMPSEYTFLCPNCRYVEIGDMQEVEVVEPDPVELLFGRLHKTEDEVRQVIAQSYQDDKKYGYAVKLVAVDRDLLTRIASLLHDLDEAV